MEETNGHKAAEASRIPVVDFAGWGEGSKQQKKVIAMQLADACRVVGFAYIVNHGIPSTKIQETFAWSKKFFDLSREKKMMAPHPNGSAVHRGYSWPGLEKVSQAYGDEGDPDLVKNLRAISDVKVLRI